MSLESLIRHKVYLFSDIAALGGLFFGVPGILVYLDKRGVKTYPSRLNILTRRERRLQKKAPKA